MRKSKSFKWMRSIYIMGAFIVVLSLTGCWSADEINNLAVVNLMAIDENEAGEVEVTTVIVKPHTLFAETAISGEGKGQFLIETATGKTVFEAMGNLSTAISETPYFGHVDAIVFGERAARERMLSSLDYFKRQSDFRPNVLLLVTKGSASDVVKSPPQLNATLGLEITNSALLSKFAPVGMVEDISQFREALSSNTIDATTGVISPAKQQGIDVQEDEKKTKSQRSDNKGENQQDIPKVLSLNGTAVFKNGHLRGFLDEPDTRGLLWIKGELQHEIVSLKCGGKNKGTVSLNITGSKSQMSPQLSGRKPKMNVNIQVDADIGQVTCSDIKMTTRQIDRLNQQLEYLVKQEAFSVLRKAKNQWQTDIFGFGKAFSRKSPDKWDQLAPNWRNGLLKEMEIDVNVSANITRFGVFKNPSKANESR
ncbi:Ger(x)C family spore germination protein [Virgibacillus litoralis]|uniref:Spore germination protein KC n=1 Tax=Virgibacillus litoralis TaxID=578221 RepID=A0ABS4HCJ4_9BACI|nr:Ger(x)C family spore germination protein [Virgibacillus litoralis]MBP1948637.1 spore germination protein KC [Virgibacillus litoralis]